MSYKYIGMKQRSFITYAVCGKCYSIYDTNIEINADGETGPTKRCSFLAFPEHRMSCHRVPCHGPLFKRVTYANGNSKVYPIFSYPYKSIIMSIFGKNFDATNSSKEIGAMEKQVNT